MIRNRSYTFNIAFLAVVGLVIIFQVFKQPVYRIFADFLSPCLSFTSTAETAVTKTLNQFKSHSNLVSENEILQSEVNKLRGIQIAYDDLKKEHDQLRQLVSLPPLTNYKYKIAQVILRDPASWGVRMSVNLGSAAGVEEGAPVLTAVMVRDEAGRVSQKMVVIGRVSSDVSAYSAVVQTLLDPQCSLSVYLPKSQLPAMIRGGLETSESVILKAHHIPLHQTISEGEGVYTSGFTPFTPAGLYIGKVVKNKYHQLLYSENNLYAVADIELAADMKAIRYVIIPVRVEK